MKRGQEPFLGCQERLLTPFSPLGPDARAFSRPPVPTPECGHHESNQPPRTIISQ
jgi:hypothetical protein